MNALALYRQLCTPTYRDALNDYFDRACAKGGHTPHLLREALSGMQLRGNRSNASSSTCCKISLNHWFNSSTPSGCFFYLFKLLINTAQTHIFILSFSTSKQKVEIRMFIIRQFTNADLDDVVNLWESCGLTRPWNSPETDIFRKVSQQDDFF